MMDLLPARSSGGLPYPRTRLIGRVPERELGRAALLDEAVPLLSVIGPGGVGKTRLALAIAHELHHAFADGVVFADLAPMRDPALVLSALATTLGIHEIGEQPLPDVLRDALRPRQLLIVLDNCEQVLGAAPEIAALLRECPAVQILATSRAPLRIQGEQVLVVPPLALPRSDDAPVAELIQTEAVALFLQRARSSHPGFAPTDEELQAIAVCCRRVDGVPLAIELAAARVRVLAPQALAARLSRRLPLLTGGRRDAPPRQQTLRATLAWTYDLLSPAQQALFRHLGVFSGGFTLEAATALAATLSTGDDAVSDSVLLDQLSTLVDWSLLQPMLPPGVGADPESLRFTMLETMREFALELGVDQREDAMVRAAHARYYLMLAEAAEAEIERFGMGRGLNRLEIERANLRAALDDFQTRQDWEDAARLLIATHKLWQFRGPIQEWLTATETVLGHLDPDHSPAALPLRFLLGMLHWVAGESEQALAQYRRCLEAARAQDDVPFLVSLLNQQALVYGWDRRDWDAAIPLEQEAVTLARTHGVPLTFPLGNLGTMLALAGDPAQGLPLIDEAIALDRATGFTYGLAVRLMLRGLAAYDAGDPHGADRWWAESLQRFTECHNEMHLVGPLSGLAALVSGYDPIQAARLLGMAQSIGQRTGSGRQGGPTALFHPLREQAEARARRALGDSVYAEAFAAGRTLPILAALHEAQAVAERAMTGSWPDPVTVVPVGGAHGAAVRVTHSGRELPPGFDLTRREREILHLLCQRLTDREMAEHLYLSPKTVANHVNNIRSKLGAHTRREAAAIAVRQGLV